MNERIADWPRQHKVLMLACAMIGLVLGTAVVLMVPKSAKIPEQLVSAKNQANYTLYFPQPLPKGFHYKPDSAHVSSAAALYTLTFGGDKTMSVSIQPKPKGVVFDDFYDRVLKHKADVFSSEGKAAIGVADGKTIGSLVTDNVWVLINTSSSIDGQAMTQLISNLKPVR